ncbi:family 43 glycosylhydrolase [Streptomyces mirabilis]|uniref:Xylan 1,4-beta-xylosidase n=1 Tax=Streptomyces mirabilis TaxID=68239 RepID=A0A1I2HJD5_9ACTN|nr:family 43 glycosylhydrolase [Streptomyces mirabilis]SFF28866.1 xylan 1,4-beta-xylosidase [Streptomyces mirabilis]
MRQRTAQFVRNPVLAGSHPDPSILRVGADFYLATSTFEWCPGVRLHHSRDLVHWRPLGGALDSTRLLDLTGCPDSGGVWAPNLSHADGLFHLVYSNVSTYAGGFTDSPNHLVTAESIDGPWSDPVPLHARGFDASLFHDGADSRLVNLVHDWRPGHGGSAGLEATRYDRATRRLVGEPEPVVLPPGAGWIEGPNLYRRGLWYYLLTADGGTGYDHQVTVARSRTLTGPYERDPAGPLITARHHPDLPLQKAGHGSLVDTPGGLSYLAYLVARPHTRHGPCVLGRETALAPVTWTPDGWPRTLGGLPALEIPAPDPLVDGTDPRPDGHDDLGDPADSDGFDRPVLGPQWSTLRRPPAPDWLSLTDRASHLRLRGGRSPQSLIAPSLVARRVTAARCVFEATMEYRPRTFQQLAGIAAYYNTRNWYFLHVTADDEGRAVLRVAARDRGELTVDEAGGEPVGDTTRLRLGLDLDGSALRFRYDTGPGWRPLGPTLDATVLSDEHAEEMEGDRIRALGFTGAFVGLWAWDLTGGGLPADFDEATYRT